jgi:hypothetical protein
MLPGLGRIPHHGVFIDTDEAARLADSTAFLEMLEHPEHFRLGQACIEQGRPLALGEAVLAGTAGQQPTRLPGPVAKRDSEVVLTALAIVWALGVLTAKATQVVHGRVPERVFRDT